MDDWTSVITMVLLGLGGVFCLLAAVGIVVMTDIYNRMQAASKSVTLGATCIVLAVGVHYAEPAIVVRCLLVCVFFFVTVPVASHLIARAAYRAREPLAPESVIDELGDHDRRA